jgi:6-pyruvoyltetrahydropterin/6-carboxytetrahydropterin synthase
VNEYAPRRHLWSLVSAFTVPPCFNTPMSITRRVRVERNRLRFAAAHMATFGGGCEPLHGHNYDVIVEVEGELTAEAWVWDFGDLKTRAKAIADMLDHRFLLQRDSRTLAITERDGGWEIRFENRHYRFPAADVVVLPIDNTTAERLAEWFANRLLDGFPPAASKTIRKLTVGVEEMSGQTGWYTVGIGSEPSWPGGPREDG